MTTRQGKPPAEIKVRSVGKPPELMLEALARLIFEHQKKHTPELKLVQSPEKTSTLI